MRGCIGKPKGDRESKLCRGVAFETPWYIKKAKVARKWFSQIRRQDSKRIIDDELKALEEPSGHKD